MKKNEKRKVNEKRFAIKMVVSLIYLIIITVLFVCSYRIFEDNKNIPPWSEVQSVDDYTYMTISKMSEKFAYYKETNIGIHFVIEEEDTGLWHTYLLAIDEDDYDEYKDIIDYTYERTTRRPSPKRVYGYPVIASEELKKLAIKNLTNFVPAENEVKIDESNYETYLTNSYLDSSQSKQENFNIILFISLLLFAIVIVLFIITLLDKDKMVDKIDNKIDKEVDRARLMYERAKEKQKRKKNNDNDNDNDTLD